MTIKLGQSFYAVPYGRRSGSPKTVTVAKVGRTWATLDSGQRINLATGLMENDYRGYADTLYASEQAYRDQEKLTQLWLKFLRHMPAWQPPAGVDEAALRKAAEILNIKLEG